MREDRNRERDRAEKAERIENWLTFDEGEIFFMPGRGVGVVSELNADLAVCRLDFEKEKRVSVPLGAAQKFLTPVSEKHMLRRKVTAQSELRAEASANPSGTFERLLQDFGRPLTVSEVKDAMIGVQLANVEENESYLGAVSSVASERSGRLSSPSMPTSASCAWICASSRPIAIFF